MLWRHCRREVTPCELIESLKALLTAAADCFAHYREPRTMLSLIGPKAAKAV